MGPFPMAGRNPKKNEDEARQLSIHNYVRVILARIAAARALWRSARSPRAKALLVRYALLLLLHDAPALRGALPSQTWVELASLRFCVSPGQRELNGFFDVWLRHSYEAVDEFRCQQNWFVVDLGANVGFFAIREAMLGGRVLAVEPNPSAARRMLQTIEANAFGEQVRVRILAVGRTRGEGVLSVGGSSINARVTPAHRDDDDRANAVAIDTLDYLLRDRLEAVDLLKIDTEGGEFDILVGAPEVLTRTNRVVLEYHSRLLREKCIEHLSVAGMPLVREHGTILYFARPGSIVSPSVLSSDVTSGTA